jgi:hypothetical protein
MENNNEITFRPFTSESPNFALVVDGEVADNFSFPAFANGEMPLQIEKLIAIFKSNPIIVEALEHIEPGSTWDGSEFTPPA